MKCLRSHSSCSPCATVAMLAFTPLYCCLLDPPRPQNSALDTMEIQAASVGVGIDHGDMSDTQSPQWLPWCDAVGLACAAPWSHRSNTQRGLALFAASYSELHVRAPWCCATGSNVNQRRRSMPRRPAGRTRLAESGQQGTMVLPWPLLRRKAAMVGCCSHISLQGWCQAFGGTALVRLYAWRSACMESLPNAVLAIATSPPGWPTRWRGTHQASGGFIMHTQLRLSKTSMYMPVCVNVSQSSCPRCCLAGVARNGIATGRNGTV